MAGRSASAAVPELEKSAPSIAADNPMIPMVHAVRTDEVAVICELLIARTNSRTVNSAMPGKCR
jgi:hypothetical protein